MHPFDRFTASDRRTSQLCVQPLHPCKQVFEESTVGDEEIAKDSDKRHEKGEDDAAEACDQRLGVPAIARVLKVEEEEAPA